MRKQTRNDRLRRKGTLVASLSIVAVWALLTSGLGHTANQTNPVMQNADPILQRSTVAVCGSPTCDCGSMRLVSKTHGPCEATAAAGGCRQGNGMCCVCEGVHTAVACGADSCACGATQAPVQINAPCELVSPVGSCRLGSGVCCICVTP